MKQSIYTLAALTALILSGSAQAATPPLLLAPATRWTADFAPDHCALRRSFATEGKKITLELNGFVYEDGFQVKVYSGDFYMRENAPKTRFEPDPIGKKQTKWVRAKLADGQSSIFYEDTIFPNGAHDEESEEDEVRIASLTQDHSARDRREAEITGLLIEDTFSKDVVLKTGSLHSAMDIMRQCLADLAATEGIDPEKIKTLSRRVTPLDLAAWVGQIQRNYPSSMVSIGGAGVVDIRLIVDETGKPIDCKTRNSGQYQQFSDTTCETMMKYAKFEPALDAQGNPVKGYWRTSVIYRLN